MKWREIMTKLIINSDDYGYSRAVNYAVIDAHQEGILTSASLLVNTTSFDHAIRLAKENPKLGVGIHLNITTLKPIRTDVPSLVDETGTFYRPDAYRQGYTIADLDDLSKEWEAQINRVIDAGIQPTHLNTHHNASYFNEHHLDVFLDLADKYQLAVRGNFESDRPHRAPEYFEPAFDTVHLLERGDEQFFLENLISKIKEKESAEIKCHVGYIDQLLHETSTLTEPRIYQTQLLIDSPFADQIRADEAIELVTYAEI